jgi:hypothetical protein
MHHNFSAIAPPIFIAIYKEDESFQEQLNVLKIYLSSFLGFIDLQLILFFQIIREAPLAIFQFLLFLILLQLGSKPILERVIYFNFH